MPACDRRTDGQTLHDSKDRAMQSARVNTWQSGEGGYAGNLIRQTSQKGVKLPLEEAIQDISDSQSRMRSTLDPRKTQECARQDSIAIVQFPPAKGASYSIIPPRK